MERDELIEEISRRKGIAMGRMQSALKRKKNLYSR